MRYSLQVLYPTDGGTEFDFDYYTSRHMEIVGASIGPHIESSVIIRGTQNPEGVRSHHAVATIVFADQAAFDAAMAAIGPAVEDIPSFYNGTPELIFGEVIS